MPNLLHVPEPILRSIPASNIWEQLRVVAYSILLVAVTKVDLTSKKTFVVRIKCVQGNFPCTKNTF